VSRERRLKERIFHEMAEYWINVGYFPLVFAVFSRYRTWYRRFGKLANGARLSTRDYGRAKGNAPVSLRTIEGSRNMSNHRFSRMAPAALFMLTLVLSVAVIAALPGTLHAADPGINQPGAVGNVGRPGVDPGINQPGAAGNVGRDPGINQPGAAGNVGAGPGVDPGINQPGAAGNVGRDPGINQPGAAGNVGNRPGVRR
jgi:hypothetical protein